MGVNLLQWPLLAGIVLLVSLNSELMTNGNSTMCHAASLSGVAEDVSNSTGSVLMPEVTPNATLGVSNETVVVTNSTEAVSSSTSVATPTVPTVQPSDAPVLANTTAPTGNKTHNHHDDDDDDDDLDDEDDDDDDDDDDKKTKKKKTIIYNGEPISVTEVLVDEKLLAPEVVNMTQVNSEASPKPPCHLHEKHGPHAKRNVSEEAMVVQGGNSTTVNGTVLPQGKDALGEGTAIETISSGISGALTTFKNSVTSIFTPGWGIPEPENSTDCRNETTIAQNSTSVPPVEVTTLPQATMNNSSAENATMVAGNSSTPVNGTLVRADETVLNGTTLPAVVMNNQTIDNTTTAANATLVRADETMLNGTAIPTVLLSNQTLENSTTPMVATMEANGTVTTPAPGVANGTVVSNTTVAVDNSTTSTTTVSPLTTTIETTVEPKSADVPVVVSRKRRSPNKHRGASGGGGGGFWETMEDLDERVFGKKDKDCKRKKKEAIAYLAAVTSTTT